MPSKPIVFGGGTRMEPTESREDLIGTKEAMVTGSRTSLHAPPADYNLTHVEKRFLLCAERGDCASVKRLLEEYKEHPETMNLNCMDPLNRSALIAAIENENVELIHILLNAGIKVKDALLIAIKEEYVEAVEILLEWEEKIHVGGEPYSWEAVDRSMSNFTPDITPLILAAHMNNYEILKILLDRGATLPMPHDVRCGCDECVVSSEQDSLRHSQSRINAYRALTSPSLIALSSRDPLLTAFELSWELRKLSKIETEFRAEYNEMRMLCQTFATSLLDHVRTSNELEIMLNHNPDGETWEPGERQTLERLKLAIKYKQKMFVAHPNVQQLLAAIWYEGLPGFRRKNMIQQLFEVSKLGAMFPVYSSIYMMAPKSKMGQFMKKPFVKFICHSSSYAFFLMLLGAASQRIEFLLIEWFGTDWMKEILMEWKRKERGAFPGLVESAAMIYVISLIWGEAKSLWSDGLLEYISDLWNVVDFITNVFYMCWISLRLTAFFIVHREAWQGMNPYIPREQWDQFDPMLLSEGAFAAGMIFSFLKLVHIFSVNPHLGPLQISLGRMILDIIKFFFIYTLVLFAFGCGLNQLLWYYADLEKSKCYHRPDGLPDFDNHERACTIWRRFTNLFETSQSLFWASFGLVDLMAFDLTGIKGFTRFWALLMFGSYSVINIIVLLNMLIAMMSNSYQIISERSDTEWKFARSHLWISYFDDGATLPPPFNMIPTTKNMTNWLTCFKKSRSTGSMVNKSREKAQERHDTVMRLLVRRYVMAEQRKRDEFGITEDDVMEIRQDISTLRFELIDVLRNNGMKTPQLNVQDSAGISKKGRVMERRLLKDFQIGLVEGIVNEAIKDKQPKDVFSKIAKAIGKRTSSKGKKDWNALVRRNTLKKDPIGSTSEAVRQSRQSLRRHILENQVNPLSTMDPQKLVDYNPNLSSVSPAARVAYAKFKIPKIKQEYDHKEEGLDSETSSLCKDADDVFVDQQTTVTDVKETDSIVRPRPKSSIKQLSMTPGKLPSQSDAGQPAQAISESSRGFRPRTPIQEDPREDMTTSEPSTPVSSAPTKDKSPAKTGSANNKLPVKSSDTKPDSSSSTSKDEPQQKDTKKEDEAKPQETKKEDEAKPQETKKEDEEKKSIKETEEKPKETKKEDTKAPDPSPRKPIQPSKPGGKSIVTGEVLQGWL